MKTLILDKLNPNDPAIFQIAATLQLPAATLQLPDCRRFPTFSHGPTEETFAMLRSEAEKSKPEEIKNVSLA
ncbi:MAG TPA: hypothetical protein VGI03_14925 [Verrucomicrobiae bacterium]|jgi:hypothetical protein